MKKNIALLSVIVAFLSSCNQRTKFIQIEIIINNNIVFSSQPIDTVFIVDNKILFPLNDADAIKMATAVRAHKDSSAMILINGRKVANFNISNDFSESAISLLPVYPDDMVETLSQLKKAQISIHQEISNNTGSKNKNFLIYRDNPEKQNELDKMLDAVQEELNRK